MNNTPLLTLPPPSHVLTSIEKWRNLDLRKKSDSEIDSELKDFLHSLEEFTVSSIIKKYSELWRLRRFHYLLKDISECWEPPPDKSKMGRCNAEGSPVLYVSEKLKTPFEELSIYPNEDVYIIKYKQISHLRLHRIVGEFNIPPKNGNPVFDKEGMLSYQILREFVRSEFLKPVGKGTEYLHRISASMCRVWFDEEDSDGWIYPSVQSPDDFNIAIKPKAAREKLKIEEIRIVRMIEKEQAINSGILNESVHPLYNMMKMVIQSTFKASIKENQITWVPSNDVGGDF